MKLLLGFLFVFSLSAQTIMPLRASGPQAVPVTGATNTTPVVVTTSAPHGYAGGEIITIQGVCTGGYGTASPVNGIRKVMTSPAPTSLTFAISDRSDTPVAANGAFSSCAAGGQDTGKWTGKLTDYTLGTQPLGFLDGLNGATMRKLALGTANGLTSLTVSGNLATATTSYNHLLTTTDKISVCGSGNSSLDLCNHTTGATGTPYSVTVTSSTTFTFPTSGVGNGTYSGVNNTCGPTATTNDLIGGTQDCLRITQLAYTGNPMWDSLVGHSSPLNSGIAWKLPADGGTLLTSSAYAIAELYGLAGWRFLADPTSSQMLSVVTYGLLNMVKTAGVNWPCNEILSSCGLTSGSEIGDYETYYMLGYVWMYQAGGQYLSTAHKATSLNSIFNDVNDPAIAPSSTSNAEFSNDNHNLVLASGLAQGGSSTTITLASSDSKPDNYYVNNIIRIYILPYVLLEYGTYTSGITAVGTVGQTCKLDSFNGGGQGGTATVKLTGTNTIASGTPLHIIVGGNGVAWTSNPTSATASSGSATCSGTATVNVVAGQPLDALVTGYVASTKIATITGVSTVNFVPSLTGSWGIAPSAGTPYRIYATVKISSATQLGTATITGYNTAFNTSGAGQTFVGDGVIGGNLWTYFPGFNMSYVSAVNSDTSLTVLNYAPIASTTIPTIWWRLPAWQPGDVGLIWEGKHWGGWPGAPPSLYPPDGGDADSFGGFGPVQASNNQFTKAAAHMALDFLTAPDDARAITDMANQQSNFFDYIFAHYMNYSPILHSGANYSFGLTYLLGLTTDIIHQSVPAYPSTDPGGNWVADLAAWKMFSPYPDLKTRDGVNQAWPFPYGNETGDNSLELNVGISQGYLMDPLFVSAPTSTRAKYLRNWLETATGFNLWGTNAISNYYDGLHLIREDPRIGKADWTVQPHQYEFIGNSAATCLSLTGWPCSTSFNGGTVISRTTWTDKTGGILWYGSRSFWNDHDTPENGTLRYYKVGVLLSCDCPYGDATMNTQIMTSNGDMLEIGGSNATVKLGAGSNQAVNSPIIRWASGNHGAWSPQYGDQDSKYVYVCSDLSTVYTIPFNYAQRCTIHLKDSTINSGTGEEIVVQWDTVSVPTPIAIDTHIHYQQNLEPVSVPYAYAEGDTTCPGSGGCANLNTNRVVQSMEDGGGPDADPQRKYGIITKFLSPGTITVRDDSLGALALSGVTKTTAVSITSITTGTSTIIQTSAAHNLATGGYPTISGVSGTGCGGINGSFFVVVTDSTHYTIPMDTSGCSTPLGGTSTTPTAFSVTGGQPLTSVASITAISTGGYPTQITTATPHGLIGGQFVQIRTVLSTSGSCNAINKIVNDAWTVQTVIDSTHYTINFDASACSGITGGLSLGYGAIGYAPVGVTIVTATGDWAPTNTPIGCSPFVTLVFDANSFGIQNYANCGGGPSFPANTSGFSGSFNGVVQPTYPGGLGHTHRVSVCAGSSCGAAASSFESLTVHKVAQNLGDTTLTATVKLTDADWYGVQTSDKVVVLARGGVTHSTMAGFTTNHSGTAQYLLGGVTPGVYDVTIGGTPVTGSPFTVPSVKDASIAFESTAGVVAFSGTATTCSISTSSLPGGTVGTPYSQTLAVTGCTGGITWGTVSGTLPAGLTLNTSTGVISGTPSANAVAPMTFSATDSAATPITINSSGLSITTTTGPQLALSPTALTFPCVSGGSDPSTQAVSITATGVTLNDWSATKGQTWLTLSPSSGVAAGTMAVGTTGCGGLNPAGSPYTDTISVASATGGIINSPQTIAVTLNVMASIRGASQSMGGKVGVGGVIKH